MKKVISGEKGGISKEIDWCGGGSFVYCEILEDAEKLLKIIENATEDNIKEIKEQLYSDDRLVPYITKQELAKFDSDFSQLNLDEKKVILNKIVNKNKLYVNYSDIDDKNLNVLEKDKKFTNSFYRGKLDDNK